jgi:hypothetical protein
MAQTSSSLLPPASAEYETAMLAGPGKLPKVHKWKMFRSSQGETHLDFGKTGQISKPGAKQTILLDHVKREARIVPAPAHSQAPLPSFAQKPPGAPHIPAPPSSSLLHVKDLGKQTIGGHEAEGKEYTFQTPKVPSAPGVPKPQVFKGSSPEVLPKPPGLPQPLRMQSASRGKPPVPMAALVQPQTLHHAPVQTLEVWTHMKLKVPILTKAKGIPGLQSSVCKDAKSGEPPASLFQIPPGYKVLEPKPLPIPNPRV